MANKDFENLMNGIIGGPGPYQSIPGNQTSMAGLLEKLQLAYNEVKNPVKDSLNPHFKSEYASLETVIKTIKDACVKHGIMVMQDASFGEHPGTIVVRTMFYTLGNVGLSFSCPVVLGDRGLNPQGTMAAFTYGRRYALLSAFCLAAEDNDGEQTDLNRPGGTQETGKKPTSFFDLVAPLKK